MGLYYVKGSLTGPTGHPEDAEFLVDTGATLLVIPRPMAERLALTPTRSHRSVIAGGQPFDKLRAVSEVEPREVWPVAEVRLTLNGEETTTPCFLAPAVRSLGPGRPAGPPLLGAVALESLFLAVDPVAKRLIPVEGFVG